MTAVLDAASELLAKFGPRATTVRDVAALAGVNHALVHRYFGTKEELVKAVLDRHAARFAEVAALARDTPSTIALLYGELAARRSYVEALARAVMDGMRPEQFATGSVMRGLLRGMAVPGDPSALGGASDPRIILAGISALALGWHIFGDFLIEATELKSLPRTEVDARIGELLQAIVAALASTATGSTLDSAT
jgi:AcrR family transcriptional regulator